MKNKGFTLIELVVVIVILGILAATAAPKFINLQAEAYTSTLEGVKASMLSAGAMVNAKSIIKGNQSQSSGTVDIGDGNGDSLSIIYGYPSSEIDTWEKLLDANTGIYPNASGSDFTFENGGTGANSPLYIYTSNYGAPNIDDCYLVYNLPQGPNERPDIELVECE